MGFGKTRVAATSTVGIATLKYDPRAWEPTCTPWKGDWGRWEFLQRDLPPATALVLRTMEGRVWEALAWPAPTQRAPPTAGGCSSFAPLPARCSTGVPLVVEMDLRGGGVRGDEGGRGTKSDANVGRGASRKKQAVAPKPYRADSAALVARDDTRWNIKRRPDGGNGVCGRTSSTYVSGLTRESRKLAHDCETARGGVWQPSPRRRARARPGAPCAAAPLRA